MRGIRHSPIHRQRGFALIVMLVLVMMGVLYLAVNGASVVGMRTARQGITVDALTQAKLALIGYAATYGDTHSQVPGYLPCPDNNGDGSADAVPTCGAAGATVIGLLPYKELGLSSNQDSDGNCLWYAVSGTFKASGSPLPAMNWDTQGQIEVRDASGNVIAQPDDVSGGAAAVVFAVGPALGAQARILPTPAAPCGVSDAAHADAVYANYIDIDPAGADLARSQPFPGAAYTTIRVASGVSGSNVDNDSIATITPREIFDLILKRADFKNALTASPPGWMNRLADKIRIGIETQIQHQLDTAAAGPIAPVGVAAPANQAAYTQFAGKQIGDAATIALTGIDATWFANWQHQYRQVACADLTSPCLSLPGTQCRGALMFGGRAVSAGPRTSSAMAPGTANLTAYFEPGQGLDMLNSAATDFAGRTTYADPNNANTDRAFDVGTCLFPGTFLSFNNGIGSFSPKSALAVNAPIAIDTAARTITLGNAAASGTNSGCAWAPATTFSTSLRAYFTFSIHDRGEGFVFAVLDADPARNSPSSLLCGDGGAALGYSGSGLNYPKLGLEIDTRRESLTNDPGTSSRPDHIAFVYWGTAAAATDDNVHGTPPATAIDGTQPLNPRGLNTLSVAAASWAANVATITTTAPHYLVPNQLVNIAGINPAGFNGSYRITPTSATTFTYALASDPGVYVAGGTAASPFHGIATVKSSDTLLPYNGVLPLDTAIHVRVDITRRHSGASGTYHLAAYVVSAPDPESVDGSCVTLSNLRNLSFDMESLGCPHGPTVSQDGIVIDDISGVAALSSVYVGFTNGQRGTAAGQQSITLSDFMMRVQ